MESKVTIKYVQTTLFLKYITSTMGFYFEDNNSGPVRS